MSAAPGLTVQSGLALPPNAPKVRATAGVGTVRQRTWVLRRPVTLIGSGPHSTIVLTEPSVAKAHCAVVNSGEAVLLKDLGSECGTCRRDERVDLALLNDGDVIQVGPTRIQIAIQVPGHRNEATDTGCTYVDPLRPARPIELDSLRGGQHCVIHEAVGVIGRGRGVAIQFDHPDVSLAHALLFRLGRDLAVCDLGSRTGTWINGERRTLSFAHAGDGLRIGPFELIVRGGWPGQDSAVGTGAACEARPDRERKNLERWARELDARETALDARIATIRQLEESLQAALGAQLVGEPHTSSVSPGNSPAPRPKPPHLVFTAAADSAERQSRTPPPSPATSGPTESALERDLEILEEGQRRDVGAVPLTEVDPAHPSMTRPPPSS
jgi:pSer/pThr/pTyr-binding forkhead associated (FHA) protein